MKNGFYQLYIFLFLFFTASFHAFAQTPGGIGAMLMLDTAKDGSTMPRIKSFLTNSPAAAQHMPEGVYIISVNNMPCKNKPLEDIVGNIRGEAGTSVTLRVDDNPQGIHPQNYTITRAVMQQAPAADPTTTFYQSGEEEAKKLKKQGFTIIKTINSECGDYFFNFDTDASPYHAKVLIMETKPEAYTKGFEAQASMFDNSEEANKTALKNIGMQEMGNAIISTLEGTMTMKRNSIGVISIQIPPLADAKRCAAMYIIVYK